MEDMIPQGSPTPHDGPGYESTEVGIRGILIFGLLLTLVTVLTMAILGGWYAAMAARERRQLQDRSPRFVDDAGQFPPPVLQATPRLDMVALADTERTRLDSFGWVDERAGIAHIPISRAIDLTLDRINANDEPPPAQPAPTVSTPAESAAEPPSAEVEPSTSPDAAPTTPEGIQ